MIGRDPTSQDERVALRIIPGGAADPHLAPGRVAVVQRRRGYAMMLIQWDNAVAPVWIASTNLLVLATKEKEEKTR